MQSCHIQVLISKIIYRTFIWAMNTVTMVTFWELTAAIFLLVSSSNLCTSKIFCSICLKLNPWKEGHGSHMLTSPRLCISQIESRTSKHNEMLRRQFNSVLLVLLLRRDLPILFGTNFLFQLSPFAFQLRKLLLLHQQRIVLVIQLPRCLLQGRQLFINVS